MLTFERGYNFSKAVYFIPNILIIVTLFIWKVFGISRILSQAEKKKAL